MNKLTQLGRVFTGLLFLFLASSNAQIYSQVLAFPGADGFGKYTTGGRGGKVIEVTNLNDVGAGSLRDAIQTSGARTIVFKVSGTIALKSDLKITYGNLTIAGQTAPGDGICVKGFSTVVQANNVIIRYMRFRPGDELKLTGATVFENDALTGKEHSNIIIDHCSMSWAIDEVSSFYDNSNFTMQWCLISESLFHSFHSKGDHGYGGIWGGMNATFHHNLLADHTSRNPRFCGARYHIATSNTEIVDYRNNVIFNWAGNSAYGGEGGRQNMVNNYYKPGPATGGSVMGRIVNPSYSADPLVDSLSYWYITGNYVFGNPTETADNWNGGFQPDAAALWQRAYSPFPFMIDSTETAEDAFNSVLANCGANLPRRDTLDKRILYETLTGKPQYGASYGSKTGIIDSQDDVGGYPELLGAYPLIDSDHDGMPDSWELDHGLNPNDSTDGKINLYGDGYTALEVYLDSIPEMKEFLEPPSQFQIKLTDYKKIKLTWKDNSLKETGFVIERKDSGSYSIIDTVSPNTISFIDTLLDYNTKYTYRVRTISNTDSSIYAGELSLTTLALTSLPLKSNMISPVNGSVNQRISSLINWEPGVGDKTHDVYFGNVNPPSFVKNMSVNIYDPGILSYNTKYYCRIDEVNDYGTTTGTVTSFTTKKSITQYLVGYWNFETVLQAADKSGWRNNGIINNITSESYKDSGALNKYIYLDGTYQYIEVPDAFVLDFDINSFSINFWLLQDPSKNQVSKKYYYLIKGSNYQNDSLNRSGKNYQVYYDSQNKKIGFRVCSADSIQSEIIANSNVFMNKWTMLTAVRDRKYKLLKLYLNNQELAEFADNTGDLSESEDLYFGHSPEDSSYLTCGLDEIRMYSYALSDFQIDSLYQLSSHNVEIKKIDDYFDCSVFPNPTSKLVTVKIRLIKPGIVSVSLQNIIGQTIRQFIQNQTLNQPDYQVEINLKGSENNIPNGLYFLTVTVDKNIKRNKILIIN